MAQSYTINEALNILHKDIPIKYTLGGHNCSQFEVQEETLIQSFTKIKCIFRKLTELYIIMLTTL